ncbi:MAG: SusD/RagB family nutrient-binding outer membrane lipoprotein [Bacteroidota bacterium]
MLILLLLTTACTTDFTNINTNENAPTEVQPSLLLRQVLYGYGDEMSYEGFVTGNLLSQHFAMTDFNLFDRHALSSPQEGGNPWDILYVNLRDTETILRTARENPALAVYEGPALIMKAYLAATLTDLFGDVPYYQAFNGRDGVVTPVYDTQESIYLGEGGILDNLEQANLAIAAYTGAIPLEGDILFDGNLDNWVRFANSLRIKYLMRISDRQEVSSELQAILDNGAYQRVNDHNATFDFTDNLPNSFEIATVRVGIFNLFVMSETSELILTGLNDPRINVLFRRSGNGNDYNGLINGINAGTTAITVDDYARPGTIFRENTGDLDYNYMTAWETNFLLAEAAAKGMITGNARERYELAVQQAFEYWQTLLPANYLSSGPAAYDPARALEQIITQKWIANIGNDYESWAEWRRTGFPHLLPVDASLNNGLYPVRFPYPADEEALNFENYQTAANNTDGNSINVPVWWDLD